MAMSMIEAFGSPGVGKSYVVENLVRVLNRFGVVVHQEPYSLQKSNRVSRVVTKTILLVSQLPFLFRSLPKIFSLLRGSHWVTSGGMLKALCNWLVVLAVLKKSSRCAHSVLLSQGLTQAVWSLAYRASSNKPFPMRGWLDVSFESFQSSRLVVLLVKADKKVIAQRLKQRTAGQSILDYNHDSALLSKSQDITDELSRCLEEYAVSQKIRLVVFDNGFDGCSEPDMLALARSMGLIAVKS